MPLKLVADISFGAGPTTIQRYNQVRRITIGADLAPGVVSGEALDEDPRAADDAEPAAGRAASCCSARTKWQAEMMKNFMIAVISGILLVLRGAGAALPPLHAAAGQHGLAAAGAARRR